MSIDSYKIFKNIVNSYNLHTPHIIKNINWNSIPYEYQESRYWYKGNHYYTYPYNNVYLYKHSLSKFFNIKENYVNDIIAPKGINRFPKFSKGTSTNTTIYSVHIRDNSIRIPNNSFIKVSFNIKHFKYIPYFKYNIHSFGLTNDFNNGYIDNTVSLYVDNNNILNAYLNDKIIINDIKESDTIEVDVPITNSNNFNYYIIVFELTHKNNLNDEELNIAKSNTFEVENQYISIYTGSNVNYSNYSNAYLNTYNTIGYTNNTLNIANNKSDYNNFMLYANNKIHGIDYLYENNVNKINNNSIFTNTLSSAYDNYEDIHLYSEYAVKNSNIYNVSLKNPISIKNNSMYIIETNIDKNILDNSYEILNGIFNVFSSDNLNIKFKYVSKENIVLLQSIIINDNEYAINGINNISYYSVIKLLIFFNENTTNIYLIYADKINKLLIYKNSINTICINDTIKYITYNDTNDIRTILPINIKNIHYYTFNSDYKFNIFDWINVNKTNFLQYVNFNTFKNMTHNIYNNYYNNLYKDKYYYYYLNNDEVLRDSRFLNEDFIDPFDESHYAYKNKVILLNKNLFNESNEYFCNIFDTPFNFVKENNTITNKLNYSISKTAIDTLIYSKYTLNAYYFKYFVYSTMIYDKNIDRVLCVNSDQEYISDDSVYANLLTFDESLKKVKLDIQQYINELLEESPEIAKILPYAHIEFEVKSINSATNKEVIMSNYDKIGIFVTDMKNKGVHVYSSKSNNYLDEPNKIHSYKISALTTKYITVELNNSAVNAHQNAVHITKEYDKNFDIYSDRNLFLTDCTDAYNEHVLSTYSKKIVTTSIVDTSNSNIMDTYKSVFNSFNYIDGVRMYNGYYNKYSDLIILNHTKSTSIKINKNNNTRYPYSVTSTKAVHNTLYDEKGNKIKDYSITFYSYNTSAVSQCRRYQRTTYTLRLDIQDFINKINKTYFNYYFGRCESCCCDTYRTYYTTTFNVNNKNISTTRNSSEVQGMSNSAPIQYIVEGTNIDNYNRSKIMLNLYRESLLKNVKNYTDDSANSFDSYRKNIENKKLEYLNVTIKLDFNGFIKINLINLNII